MLIKKLNLSVTKKSLIDRDRQGQALKGEKNAHPPAVGGVESLYLCHAIYSCKL